MIRITDRVTYRDIRDPGYHYDVAGSGFRCNGSAESSVNEDLIDLVFSDTAVSSCYGNHLRFLYSSACYASDPKPADIIVISECRYLQLQRLIVHIRIRVAMLCYAFEERFDAQSAIALWRLADLCGSLAYLDTLYL